MSTPDVTVGSGQGRLGGLGPVEWDRLAGRNFYSSAGWLGFCATDFGRDSGAAVSYRDGTPVGALPFVATDDSLFEAYRWHDLLAERGLPAPEPAGVLVGPREGYQSHLLGSDLTDAEIAELVRQVRGAAASGAPGRACVAMYLPTEDVLALQRAGVTAPPVLLEADAWIEAPEGGWPAWEELLSSKRRGMVRREVRQFQDAGFRVERLPLSACWEQLGGPASATLAKHGRASESEAELTGVLRNHVRCLGEAPQTALLRDPGGAVMAFCLYYVWADTIFLRWAGFDYHRLAGAGEYFNLVYYAQLELAFQRGLRWLHAGVKSIDAKALRGATLRPLWLVDLTEPSPLASAGGQVERHNAAQYRLLRDNPRTAGMLDEPAWTPLLLSR